MGVIYPQPQQGNCGSSVAEPFLHPGCIPFFLLLLPWLQAPSTICPVSSRGGMLEVWQEQAHAADHHSQTFGETD